METDSSIVAQLRKMKTLLSPKNLEDLLDMKVGSWAARRNRGQEPAFIKIGGMVRYDPNVVADWLERQTVTPAAPPAPVAPPPPPAPLPNWLQATRAKAAITGEQP